MSDQATERNKAWIHAMFLLRIICINSEALAVDADALHARLRAAGNGWDWTPQLDQLSNQALDIIDLFDELEVDLERQQPEAGS